MQRRYLTERDAFPKSADEYAQQMERFLQLRRAGMDARWEHLEEGWTAIHEHMERLGLTPRLDSENVVKLNVGGLDVTVCWHLLVNAEGFKNSVLGALLEGVWGMGRIPRDADGRIVLDESPACVKHMIVQTTLGATGHASSAAERLPELAARSAVAVDELPSLIYTAHVLELWRAVPAHPRYVKVNGGSTVLEPFEVAPFSAVIRKWVGASTDEMTLIYRATRDGFDGKTFRARCTTSSPNTISLIRVSSGEGNDDDDDSVVGGYSVYPWSGGKQGLHNLTEDMFVFMLKDGSAARKDLCKHTKSHPGPLFVNKYVSAPRGDGPSFGPDCVATVFNGTPGSCTIQVKQSTCFHITESSPAFLALNGKQVVDIEVYRYSTPAPPTITTTAPSTTKPGGDALIDAEAHDIRLFGESIASSLMEERVTLDGAVQEMEAAGARVSAAVGALEAVYGPRVAAGEQDAVVELNVRGTRMTPLRSTLQACPRSALATMFDEERWPAKDKDKDEHGRRLIDCNPVCFSKILDVLRMRKRASWSQGTTPEKQEGTLGKCPGATLIKKADLKTFRTAVQMYFPGCESFIMGLCSVYTTTEAW